MLLEQVNRVRLLKAQLDLSIPENKVKLEQEEAKLRYILQHVTRPPPDLVHMGTGPQQSLSQERPTVRYDRLNTPRWPLSVRKGSHENGVHDPLRCLKR